jgi:hypothetical protein
MQLVDARILDVAELVNNIYPPTVAFETGAPRALLGFRAVVRLTGHAGLARRVLLDAANRDLPASPWQQTILRRRSQNALTQTRL